MVGAMTYFALGRVLAQSRGSGGICRAGGGQLTEHAGVHPRLMLTLIWQLRGADWSWPSPTRIEYETHGILFLALPRTISLLGMATTAWQLTRHPTGDMACSEPRGLRSRSEKDLWTNVVCTLRTQVNSLSPCLAVAVLVLLHIFLLVSC